MKSLIVALVIAVGIVAAADTAHASIAYRGYELHEYRGHYYGLTQTAHLDWHAAEAEAQTLETHLLAIGSQEEQDWIVDTFLPEPDLVSPPVFWIGLTDERIEGTFVWTNGDPLTYTNWNDAGANGGSVEPNDAWDGEDYVTINWHFEIDKSHNDHVDTKGTWNDFPPTGSPEPEYVPGPYYGIVELGSNPVPAPSSLTCMAGLFAMALIARCWRRRNASS